MRTVWKGPDRRRAAQTLAFYAEPVDPQPWDEETLIYRIERDEECGLRVVGYTTAELGELSQ